jgi:predicted ribosome quality control (RQC) complex YloA/Tae2 family protein
MPFDGVVARCAAEELNNLLTGGRIDKIFQPERDEINILIRNQGSNYRLLLSANSSLPRVYLTRHSKENPSSPPLFCMILRKHLGGGKITGVSSEKLERVITLRIESADEMGDISEKRLIAEIMGKHSNIILLNQSGKIIDALKHIDSDINRVREIMPAREYTPPPAQNKLVPGEAAPADVVEAVVEQGRENPSKRVETALLDTIMGFSPLLCRELCHRAGLPAGEPLGLISGDRISGLALKIAGMFSAVDGAAYSPCLIYDSPDRDKARLLDFHCLNIGVIGFAAPVDSINDTLDRYFYDSSRDAALRQKKAHLLKLVNNNIDRCKRKLAIQQDNIRNAANADNLRLFGELLLADAHSVISGSKTARLLNYYSEGQEYVDIPLDENLSPQANAQTYFKKYKTARKTPENSIIQQEEALRELNDLESVLHELDISADAHEIDEIKQELSDQKYIAGQQKNSGKRKAASPAAPHLYYSSDGLRIYVGKNNRQNDALTFRTASSNDIWLHAKNIPGSHVIIKKEHGDIPEMTVFEGAMLAAMYSAAKMSFKVNVDYTATRNVKKPPGAKPGMVIYDNYKTLTVTPSGSFLESLKMNSKERATT